MKPENIEKWIKDTDIDTNAGMDRVVLDDVLKALEQSRKQTAVKQPGIWRIIIKSKMIKIAAVVVIVITIQSIFEFSGPRDTGLVSVALARTTEALKKAQWVHISCTAERSNSHRDGVTKSEMWRNHELQISIIVLNDSGTVQFCDIGKNLKYKYNPKNNEIIVSEYKVTEKFSAFPIPLQEYIKVFKSRNKNSVFSHWEDVIDGNSVRVFKISCVRENGVRIEREFTVDPESDLPLTSYSKSLYSDGSVLEGRMVFTYPKEGPRTIYDVGGVRRSAKVYGYGPEGAEIPDVERPGISESANKLKALGKALLIYANDHGDKYPDTLKDVKYYMRNEQDFQWTIKNVEYTGKSKEVTISPYAVIAYDKTLLEKGEGTNVLYNDLHVAFEKPKRLEKLGIKSDVRFEGEN